MPRRNHPERRYKPTITNINKIYLEQGRRCLRCHEEFALDKLTVHHQIQENSHSLIILLCKRCHDMIEPWRPFLEKLDNAIKEIHSNYNKSLCDRCRELIVQLIKLNKSLAIETEKIIFVLTPRIWEQYNNSWKNGFLYARNIHDGDPRRISRIEIRLITNITTLRRAIVNNKSLPSNTIPLLKITGYLDITQKNG